jgi:hypothetical protein
MAHDTKPVLDAVQASNFIIHDGCLIDPDTGVIVEVLGRGIEQRDGDPWVPQSAEDVNWVLRKASEAEDRAARLKARQQSFASKVKTATESAKFFKDRWKVLLIELTEKVLKESGEKGSMVSFDEGDLVVTTTKKHSFKVADDELAERALKKLRLGKRITKTKRTVVDTTFDLDGLSPAQIEKLRKAEPDAFAFIPEGTKNLQVRLPKLKKVKA